MLKFCRVPVYENLNQYQIELLNNGHRKMWIAIDENHETLFESLDFDKIADFANNTKEVTHVSIYVIE